MIEKQESLPGLPERRVELREESVESKSPRLKQVDRRQLLLRAIDVERLIDDTHPARAIWDFVGQLDLRSFTSKIGSVEGAAGRPAHDPHVLISLWVYGYSRGVSSARAIARECDYEPGCQWLTGMEAINAHTLSDFRVEHAEALQELFVQTLGLLSEQGLITLERVMLDGTKIRANASSSGFRSKSRIEEFLEQARAVVKELDLQTEEESSLKMQAARQRAKREKEQRLASALEEFNKLKAAKSRVERVSTSDPDARIMKQAEGGTAPSYNVQVSTDAAHGLIVDIEANQAGSDYRQLTPAVERLEQDLQRAPKQVVVDGGYISGENIVEMARRGIDLVGPEAGVSNAKRSRNKAYKYREVAPEYEASKFTYDATTDSYRCPQGKQLRYYAQYEQDGSTRYRYKASQSDCDKCPAKNQCCPRARKGRSVERYVPSSALGAFRLRMQSDEAKSIYRTRSQVAEFPNLWIKAKFCLRQFNVRGLAKVRIESLWLALTYDIIQWIRLTTKARAAPI